MTDKNDTLLTGESELDLEAIALPVNQFSQTFSALEEFLGFIAPQVLEFDAGREERIKAELRERMDQLPYDTRETFLRDLDLLLPTLTAARDETDEILRQVHPESARIFDFMVSNATVPTKYPLLLQSLLPMAVGAFEVLIGQLTEFILRRRPGLLGSDNKEFSLDDLRRFGSIEDAFEGAIERRVEAMLLRGLDEWLRWLSKRGLDVNLRDLPLDWATFFEAFQRRHIIVHNSGRVSRRYLEKMRALKEELPELGSIPPIDPIYVQSALDNLLVTGALLAIHVEKNLRPGGAPLHVSRLILEASLDLMRKSRWQAVEKLCGVTGNLKGIPEFRRLEFRCGVWLARKRQNGKRSIRAEVESWNASASGPYFRALQHALLDRNLMAARDLVIALDYDLITHDKVFNSPFFAEVTKNRILASRRTRGKGPSAEEPIEDPS